MDGSVRASSRSSCIMPPDEGHMLTLTESARNDVVSSFCLLLSSRWARIISWYRAATTSSNVFPSNSPESRRALVSFSPLSKNGLGMVPRVTRMWAEWTALLNALSYFAFSVLDVPAALLASFSFALRSVRSSLPVSLSRVTFMPSLWARNLSRTA